MTAISRGTDPGPTPQQPVAVPGVGGVGGEVRVTTNVPTAP